MPRGLRVQRRIVWADVLEVFADRETFLCLHDMGALIAGAKYRGVSRTLKAVLTEIASSQGKMILFIDELRLQGQG